MRSQNADSVQPPGIGMPGIDIDVQYAMLAAALTANSKVASAKTRRLDT
jgi:hypothetical protein